MSWKKAIVVGASSGIGEQIVRQLAETGCDVVAVARREERLAKLAENKLAKVFPMVHDVHNVDEVPVLFQEACKLLGGLDLVIYAAGVMPDVELHEFNAEKDRDIFAVNVVGAMAWLNQAAIRFQNVRHGTILAIGSVAGDRGRRGQPAYNASKAALATYMEALRNRLSKLGVTVVTVKPGPVFTEMTERLSLKKAISAEQAALLILKKARKPGEHYLSPVHKLIFAVIKVVPSPIFRRLKL